MSQRSSIYLNLYYLFDEEMHRVLGDFFLTFHRHSAAYQFNIMEKKDFCFTGHWSEAFQDELVKKINHFANLYEYFSAEADFYEDSDDES